MLDCLSDCHFKLGSIGHSDVLLGIYDIGFRTCATDRYNHVSNFIGFQLVEIYGIPGVCQYYWIQNPKL